MARIIANQYCRNCHSDVPASKGFIHRTPVCTNCGHKTISRRNLLARRDRKKNNKG